jgi:DNA-binding transcriptional ArsR family regulator
MADGKQRKGREERRPSQGREEADAVLLKALSHPVRARALTALNQRVASPQESRSKSLRVRSVSIPTGSLRNSAWRIARRTR